MRLYQRLARGQEFPQPKLYRNPVALAQEWRQAMAAEGLTRAGLARKLRVSRARVTQVLRLLELDPKAAATIVALGDPQPLRVVTERVLRPFIDLPLDKQKPKVAQLARRAKERPRDRARLH